MPCIPSWLCTPLSSTSFFGLRSLFYRLQIVITNRLVLNLIQGANAREESQIGTRTGLEPPVFVAGPYLGNIGGPVHTFADDYDDEVSEQSEREFTGSQAATVGESDLESPDAEGVSLSRVVYLSPAPRLSTESGSEYEPSRPSVRILGSEDTDECDRQGEITLLKFPKGCR